MLTPSRNSSTVLCVSALPCSTSVLSEVIASDPFDPVSSLTDATTGAAGATVSTVIFSAAARTLGLPAAAAAAAVDRSPAAESGGPLCWKLQAAPASACAL